MKAVDAAISHFGKPYQTAVCIASLLEASGERIDTIHLQFECAQPADGPLLLELLERHDWPVSVFRPRHHTGWRAEDAGRLAADPDYRLSVRYQHALETTDKERLFICHNDVRFDEDLVGLLASALEGTECAGAGMIGQCWNCPAHAAGICSSERYDQLVLGAEEALALYRDHPSGRPLAAGLIAPLRPIPLPECRLNEHACLLDVAMYRRETMPVGRIVPFGSYQVLDLGCAWFRHMCWKGYRFAHVPVLEHCHHAWTNEIGGGHPALFDEGLYRADEAVAKAYYEERYARRRARAG